MSILQFTGVRFYTLILKGFKAVNKVIIINIEVCVAFNLLSVVLLC